VAHLPAQVHLPVHLLVVAHPLHPEVPAKEHAVIMPLQAEQILLRVQMQCAAKALFQEILILVHHHAVLIVLMTLFVMLLIVTLEE
jgi:hypothetical protein